MEARPVAPDIPFANGYLSGLGGFARVSNPERTDSLAASLWFEGWDLGCAKRAVNRDKPVGTTRLP
jgi:hypothetical protein